MKKRKLAKLIVAILMVDTLFLWGGGFLWYVTDVQSRQPPAVADLAAIAPPDHTAIITLTGGSDRIAAGVKLLQEGAGKKLFISGAGTDMQQLLAAIPHEPALGDCCIALGYQAKDTIGNARETAAWLQGQPYHSILLVTAHYHMARSLLAFQQLLPPTITIIPYAVAPANVAVAEWWRNPSTARLLLSEYSKLLIYYVKVGLSKVLA